jgi:asparagine synthase (glutamine-hydrolysing)
MSVQFGRWNTDGKPVDRDYLAKVRSLIAPYGPDDEGAYATSNLSILYRAFHTTKESRRETQPHVAESGVVITWDGRLDNRAELIRQLRNGLTSRSPDVSVFAAAYEEWGANCFAKLIGDWALSIWDATSRSLILAKDPIGTRHLYYSADNGQVTWSTILDPLVLFGGKTFALCEEYIAGWFSFFPATHLTPFVGIHSVPPSSSVVIRNGKHSVTKYWDFDPAKRIRYHTDAEYEEHFRVDFAEAVRRRLRSDRPILAELSGGMDSSSIVCVADSIISRGAADAPRLDTVSYYDDSDPNWNERPYFEVIEEKRGRVGTHIDVGNREPFNFQFETDHFSAVPAADVRRSEASRRYAACLTSQGNRVVLSGIGGDEFTGGVPTPTPEIEDLLAQCQLRALTRQLKAWALNKRKPVFYLFFEAVRSFFPSPLFPTPKGKQPPPWLNPRFVKRNRVALQGYEQRSTLFGPLPSFQNNLSALDALRRQLLCCALPSRPPHEKRYPYLDRSLLEFIFAIPREQLVRPGQRRSLLRRALVGMVPDQVLNRKRKGYVSRGPRVSITTGLTSLMEMSQHMVASSLSIVQSKTFSETLLKASLGQTAPIVLLMRTLGVEIWLRRLSNFGILGAIIKNTQHSVNCCAPTAISAEKN